MSSAMTQDAEPDSRPEITPGITPGITIVICTFNRHDLLREALASIAALRDPGGVPLRVLVVDNSDDANAVPVVDAMRDAMRWPLAAIEAHPANISVARNAGAAAATTETVAFIDDDQQLDPDWLAAVDRALRDHPHDVFFGSVEGRFETPERAGRTVRTLFSRQLDAPAGHEMYAMGPKKTKVVALATNNSIFRKAGTLNDVMPFDPRFGNGGGEDYDLFCRLQRRGRRFGWLPDAKAFEYVPAARCDADYVARRLFAGGQAYAMAVSINSHTPRIERMRQRLIAVAQLVLMIPVWLRHVAKPQSARDEVRFRTAGILGKLSFRTLEPIYRADDKPSA